MWTYILINRDGFKKVMEGARFETKIEVPKLTPITFSSINDLTPSKRYIFIAEEVFKKEKIIIFKEL